MEITLTKIPGTSKKHVTFQWQLLSQATIEILIAELYRADSITFKEVQNLPGDLPWQETAAILEHHGCELYHDRDDFEQDLKTLGLANTREMP